MGRRKPRRLRSRAYGAMVPYALALLLPTAVVVGMSKDSGGVEDNKNGDDKQAAYRLASDYQTQLVPVPLRAIAKGEEIKASDIEVISWPSAEIRPQFSLDERAFIGRYANRPLLAGVPIPKTGLSENGSNFNAVAEKIPEGMRAITVRVDQEAAVEGWAQPGSFVDVILIQAAEKDDLRAKVIAENIRILSAGRSTESDSFGGTAPKIPNTITILVSQGDALKIKTAEGFGRITFAMRSPGDKSPASVDLVNQKSIFGSSSSTKSSFKGYAKGPNGQTYVLSNNSTWKDADPSVLRE